MKLTPERARELRSQGVKVDMRQIIREPKPETAAEAPKDDFTKPAINHLLTIAEQSEKNIGSIINLQGEIAKALTEIAKPKPKKNWKCAIGRNGKGEMIAVDINEV